MMSCAEVVNPYEYAWMCYEQGKALREAGEPVKAMQSFITAEQNVKNNHGLHGRIYSNMANMCRQAERHEMAYDIYTLSTEQFALSQDTLAVAYALNNMAWEQAVMGHKDTAFALIDSALSVYPAPAVQSKVKESLAAAYLYADEYDSALLYAREVTDTLYASMLLAQAHAFSGQCDSALLYAKRVAVQTTNPRYLDNTYYILTHCDSTAGWADVVALSEKRNDVQRDIEHYKSEMAQAVLLLQQSQEKQPFPWCRLLIALGVLAAVSITVYQWLRTNKRRQIKRVAAHLQQCKDPKSEIPWNLCDLPAKLHEHGLTERETRIATLVLLGFSYAQIADILNRAESGIGKDKYLIAKKLGVSVKDLQTTLYTIACRN